MAYANLFNPIEMGSQTFKNRVFMAPLTRLRSIEPGDMPNILAAEYYSQRAGAGLVITKPLRKFFTS